MLRTIRLTTAIVCFYTYHPAFSRLHGDIAYLVRMVGENSIPAGFISLEYRCGILFLIIYNLVRTYLLFCHLSFGSISGCYFVGIRQTKEKSVPLFSGYEMVPLWRFRSVYYYDGCRIECFGYSDGTL